MMSKPLRRPAADHPDYDSELTACALELIEKQQSNISTSNNRNSNQQSQEQPRPRQQQQQQLQQQQHQVDCDSAAPLSPMGATATSGHLQLAAVQNKRKEKARIAARARRSQEASIIMEMAAELQITQEKLRRIDKATIVKLAIDYMKAFGLLCMAPTKQQQQQQQQLSRPERLLAISYDDSNLTQQKPRQVIIDEITTSTSSALSEQENHSRQRQLVRSYRYDDDEESDDDENNNNRYEANDDQQEQQVPASNCDKLLARPEQQHQQQQQQLAPLFSAPRLATASIFAPKTVDNMNSHFLMIEENKADGKSSFVLKPDTEILDDDDLTHLAPQAGDISISLEVEPLDGISSDDLLMLSPKSSVQAISVFFNCQKAA